LSYQPLFSESIYLCCGKGHPFFNQVDTAISEEILGKASAIHPGINIDIAGKQQLEKLNLAAKSYQFDTRKAMILSGSYIGYMPQSFIQTELNSGEIRIIKPSTHYYQFRLSLVNKKNPRENKKVELLTSVFAQVFNL